MFPRRLAILILLTGGSASHAVPTLPCNSVEEYRTLLSDVRAAAEAPSLDADALASRIPAECAFQIAGKQFRFTTAQIHAHVVAIKSAKAQSRAAEVAALARTIEGRRAALEGYASTTIPDARAKLEKVFTRREFARVGKQDPSAFFREQFFKLLIKLFSLIARNAQQAALFARIFIWSVVALVAAFLFWRLYVWTAREGAITIKREILPFAPSAKHWTRWMDDARAALARGDLREAVHSSYWAAISKLESTGAWVPDKAHTPREYLRLMKASDPARPFLSEISRTFEVVWYGERVPAQADCEAYLASVERFACR